MANFAIIVAGGKGKRFGGKKQFYPLLERPALLYSIDVFESSPVVKSIVLVVPQNKIAFTKRSVLNNNYKKVHHIVAGGSRRQDSVLCGLKTINSKDGIVAIHDAVRPIVSPKIIKRGFKYCQRQKAVVFGIPITDTIKRVKKNIVLETVPRNFLYLTQTPQFFALRLLRDVYKRINFKQEYTDEASIIEKLGIPVYLYLGDKMNLKITEQSDISLIERIII